MDLHHIKTEFTSSSKLVMSSDEETNKQTNKASLTERGPFILTLGVIKDNPTVTGIWTQCRMLHRRINTRRDDVSDDCARLLQLEHRKLHFMAFWVDFWWLIKTMKNKTSSQENVRLIYGTVNAFKVFLLCLLFILQKNVKDRPTFDANKLISIKQLRETTQTWVT